MIVFRADGNQRIGAGHIMRCLSIANSANEMGESCKFILSSADFQNIITKNGHQTEVLNSDYSVLNPNEITDRLSSDMPSIVIVDSYFITEEFMEAVHIRCKRANCRFVYIDDRCNAAYSCDVVVNYNISADIEKYKKMYEEKGNPDLLIGTAYAPLRKEFQDQADRVVSNNARNIMVSSGGADPEHFTLDLVDEAKKHDDYCFHFVLGMMNPDNERIREVASNTSNIIIHENVTEMGKLMRSCDVAVSASGSTLYELCATQTPAITYILADNQVPLASEFDKRGIIHNCGDIRIIGKKVLAETLICEAAKLADDYKLRTAIAKVMSAVVDGNGAKRIIESVQR